MCSFRQHEDLAISGEGGIRTHGGPKDHNGFRDRPVQPLRHLSGVARLLYQISTSSPNAGNDTGGRPASFIRSISASAGPRSP